jgi:hypothetical protein
MISYRVPLLQYLLVYRRVLHHILSKAKESSKGIVLLQCAKYKGGYFRMWSIIEAEINLFTFSLNAPGIRAKQLLYYPWRFDKIPVHPQTKIATLPQ